MNRMRADPAALPDRMFVFFGRFLARCAVGAALMTSAIVASAQTNAQADAWPAARAACTALRGMDFSTIEDAPTQLQAATVAALAPGQPEVCRVDGYVGRGTGFMLALPLHDWNGKYAQGGCGGACGVTIPWWCFDAVNRGYACLSSDMGHRSSVADWQWAKDDIELRSDFGYRSTHFVSLAGKALTAAYLGRPPSRAYFMGCSTGGRQAYVEAQRFPGDFDGIIAGAAPHSETGSGFQLAWTTLANMDADGSFVLQERQARLLHDAVVAQCDMNDGIRDGLIGDPRQCRFDPGVLACTAGANGDQCLTPQQVAAARRMYGGPVDAQGRRIGTQGGVMPGSEINWIGDYMPRGDRQPQYVAFMTGFFRYMGFDPSPPAGWKLKDLDFLHDRDRMAGADFPHNAQNPDLREFKQRGGKMIGFQGWSDTSVVPLGTLDYYDTVTRTMGGLAKTQDFYRLFVVPGMRHCSADSEGADNIDFLGALDAWVEKNQAPDTLVGYQVDHPTPIFSTPIFPIPPELIRRTRVVFPYPDEAHYNGKGNPDDPANWMRIKGLPQAVP